MPYPITLANGGLRQGNTRRTSRVPERRERWQDAPPDKPIHHTGRDRSRIVRCRPLGNRPVWQRICGFPRSPRYTGYMPHKPLPLRLHKTLLRPSRSFPRSVCASAPSPISSGKAPTGRDASGQMPPWCRTRAAAARGPARRTTRSTSSGRRLPS